MPGTGILPNEMIQLTVSDILLRLLTAAVIGGAIGYERRIHNEAIGVAGMMLVALSRAIQPHNYGALEK